MPGGVYGKYITIGRAVYWFYDGSRTRYIILIADGGRYGMDSIDTVEYNGAVQSGADWIFHPGTLTKQISPVDVSAIDTGTDVLTSAAHPFNNGDLVRLGIIDGVLPAAIDPDLKYQISDDTANTFKLKDSTGTTYIEFADDGMGQVIIWKADAGFDDPVQGLPTYAPEVLTTFSNIAYVEGRLTAGVSTANAPDWSLFRIVGTGRRLMDYDYLGNELGLLPVGHSDLSNVALQIVDNALVNYHVDMPTRNGWTSWRQLRESSDVLVWQRVVESDDAPAPAGFVARYYQNVDFTSLIVTRTDPTINMGGTGLDSPAPGVDPVQFSVRWTAIIIPLYTENYTFTLEHDNQVGFYLDGVLILSEVSFGIHTVVVPMVAAREYSVQVDLIQFYGVGVGNAWECRFSWQSTSQAFEIVPAAAAIPTDRPVKRYENHAAFPIPTEASEVHERLMERVPGWDWTDDNGKIEFLPPDRPVVFSFLLDRSDDDSKATFAKEKFEKKRRALADRNNFLLFRFRDVELTGYPHDYVQADREDLRRFTSGVPTNNPAEDLGVMTRSLAERLAEFEMVLKSDPKHTYNVVGARASGIIRKNQRVAVQYYDVENNFVADDNAIATFHSWGSTSGQNDFSLLPVPSPIYTDEVYVGSEIAVVATTNAVGDGDTTVTPPINTTRASLLVIHVGYQGAAPTVTDSYGNTWQSLTEYSGGVGKGRLYYCEDPVVGVGHTFTAFATGSFNAMIVAAFENTNTDVNADMSNGAGSASATTQQPGSITPSVNRELVVSGLTFYETTNLGPATIDSSFTVLGSTYTAVSYSVALAWKVQSTAAAENPTWTSPAPADRMIATIASFKHF